MAIFYGEDTGIGVENDNFRYLVDILLSLSMFPWSK